MEVSGSASCCVVRLASIGLQHDFAGVSFWAKAENETNNAKERMIVNFII